jgi:hypothetical protein
VPNAVAQCFPRNVDQLCGLGGRERGQGFIVYLQANPVGPLMPEREGA